MAQILMGIGTFIMIACTFSTLQDTNVQSAPVADPMQHIIKLTAEPHIPLSSIPSENQSPIVILKEELNILDKEKEKKVPDKVVDDQKRLEPPIPQEPEVKADLDPQALQKEDKEIQKEMPPSSSPVENTKKDKTIEKQEKLLEKMEKQHKEQELILKEQKKVLEELKLHKESHEDLKKADPEQHQAKQLQNVIPEAKEPIPLQRVLENTNSIEKDKALPKQLQEVPGPIIEINEKSNILSKQEQVLVLKNASEDHLMQNVIETQNGIKVENHESKPAVEETKVEKTIPKKINLTFENAKQTIQEVDGNRVIPPHMSVSTVNTPPEPVKTPKESIIVKESQKPVEDRVLMREPLAEKLIEPPEENINKNVKIHDILVGHQKLPI